MSVPAAEPVPGWARRGGHIDLPAPHPIDGSSVADRLAVGERVARYGWAFDERDRAALAGCFTTDGTWTASIGGTSTIETMTGPDAISAWLASFWDEQTDQRRHVFSNLVIDLDGDTARAHAYLTLLASTDGTTKVVTAGPYRLALERSADGTWLIRALEAGFDVAF